MGDAQPSEAATNNDDVVYRHGSESGTTSKERLQEEGDGKKKESGNVLLYSCTASQGEDGAKDVEI